MEKSKPVLVAGSTGFLGTEICRLLTTQNKKVKALVRNTSDPSKLEMLSRLGVETVPGDLKDTASLRKALEGVGSVISTASSTISHQAGDSIETVDRQGQLDLVNAAMEAGVKQFVFISFPESAEQFPLQDAKREVEKAIQDSGMPYTILRPGFFMEVWLGPHLGFDAQNGKATIYGQGTGKISWISIRDVAAFAVAALDHPQARNRIIHLGGPEALSPLEVVRLFEQETGKQFEVQHVPEEALRAQMEGPADPLQRSFTALMLTYAAGSAIPMEETARDFGIHLTSIRDFCHAMAGKEKEPASAAL